MLSAKSWRLPNRSSRSRVVEWKAAAALALARAISGVTQSAPSIRSQTIRCPASSTTAIATLKPSACAWATPRSTQARARSRVSATSGDLHPDVAALDRDGIRVDPPAARRHHTLPGTQVEHPAVPGTREPRAGQSPFAEGAALMRALVAAREHLVTDPREYDAGAVGLDQLELARRQVVEPADVV